MKCKCPICNKEFNNLTKHVQMAHHMSKEEFLSVYPNTQMISSETSNKISNSLRSNWKNPEYARRCSAYWNSELHAHRKSKDLSNLWKERHDELSSKIQDFANSDKGREIRSSNLSLTLSKLWKDEQYIQSKRDSGRVQMIKNMTNPSYGHKKYQYNGCYFRSSWEVKVAKILDLLDIKWEYEKHQFKYVWNDVTRVYIPDFYLTDLKLYLEVKPECMISDLTNTKLNSVKAKGYQILYCVNTQLEYIQSLVNSPLS